MATPVSGVNSWLTTNYKPLSFRPEDENEALNIIEYSYATIRVTARAPEELALFIDDEQLETARYGIWTWNPKHYAGLYRLVVQAPGYPALTTRIRVFPQKLTQPLYEKMKADLSKIAIDLQFSLASPALERALYAPQAQEEASPLRDYKKDPWYR